MMLCNYLLNTVVKTVTYLCYYEVLMKIISIFLLNICDGQNIKNINTYEFIIYIFIILYIFIDLIYSYYHHLIGLKL